MEIQQNNSLLDITLINYGSPEYKAELLLRDKVLRKPLGMSLFDENLNSEINDIHIGSFSQNNLVSVLILTKLSFSEIKMRQFAVADNFRSMGIGSKMVVFAEEYCKKNHFECIVLNARISALDFYKRLGYTIISEEFLEIGIPHIKLQKIL